MGFTCGDILLIPYFKEAVVLAGINGMNRAITRVNVMEVPDVIDWVRPGDFLITSGFPFRDEPDVIAEIIPQLAAKGVAALGIKTKRFVDRIPEHAIEAADRLDFPIFELPPSTVFSDVVRDIMERVLVQEARELSLLQSRFQKLSQRLLHGDGIGEFLQALEEMLNNPVILLDAFDHAVYSSQAQRIAETAGQSVSWAQLRDDINLGVSFVTVGDRRTRVYISAVDDRRHNKCLLILLEWNQEHSVVDRLTIDRVGILAGLEMINASARKEVESKYVDQFLQDWLSGRIVSPEDLKIRAEACGCPIAEDCSLYAGVIRWHERKPSAKQLQQLLDRLRNRPFRAELHATLLEGELVLIIPHTPESGHISVIADSILADIKSHLTPETPYSVCMGYAVERPEQISESYDRARKIHDISGICDLQEPYLDDSRLGVFRLLYLLPENDEVKAFRDRYILPLLAYDNRHHTQLFDTLRIYFKHNRNVKKTSEELFAHYNTVSYRVERACEILQVNAEDGDDILQLQLAMKLHEIRPANEGTVTNKKREAETWLNQTSRVR